MIRVCAANTELSVKSAPLHVHDKSIWPHGRGKKCPSLEHTSSLALGLTWGCCTVALGNPIAVLCGSGSALTEHQQTALN